MDLNKFLKNEDIIYSMIYYYINDSTNKKTPIYECNNLSIEDLELRNKNLDNGYINHFTTNKNYNKIVNINIKPQYHNKKPLSQKEYDSIKLVYSLFLKYSDNIYVIDIDEESIKSLDDFIKLLKSLGDEYKGFRKLIKNASWIKGNTKGIHIYIRINNMIKYTNQIDIFKGFKGDLIKKTNIWESSDKVINNYKDKLTEIDYEDIKCIIDFEKNKKKDKQKKEKKERKTKEEKKKEEEDKIHEYYNENLTLEIEPDDELIREILNSFDKDYFTGYQNWLILTNVMKFHNKFDIWDEYCKSIDGYNKENNYRTWDNIKPLIDINYLILKSNKRDKLIERYRKIDNLDINKLDNIKIKEDNKKYLVDIIENKNHLLTYEDFINNDVIGINSGCGTGKTSGMNYLMSNYLKENKDIKFLSIVNKISLSDQHIETFEDINLVSYQDENKDIYNDNLVVCINSLLMLNNISSFKNYVIYIDEITDLCKTLTHSENLHIKIGLIYTLLLKMIRECKKFIISDNQLNNASYEFLGYKISNNKLIIKNNYLRFKNTEAIRIRNEYIFIDKLKYHIRKKTPFIMACDSVQKVNDIMALLDFNEDIKMYVGGDGKIVDTNNYDKDYIIYSPKITTGVDFNKTPVISYLYIKGDSIDSELLYQQVCRNRLIKKLYYYCNDVKSKKPNYDNYEDCKNYYKNLVECNNKVFENMCVNKCVDDDIHIRKVVENKFFKLFTLNEYDKDCYNTNKRIHFENLLRNQGWILKCEGDIYMMDDKELKKIRGELKEIKDIEYEEYINGKDNMALSKRVEYLRLPVLEKKEILTKYKEVIKTNKGFDKHLKISKLLYNNDYVDMKLDTLKQQSFNVIEVDNVYTKLKHLHEFEKKYNIKFLDKEYKYDGSKIEINDNEWFLLKNIFKSEKDKPKTKYDLIKFYVQALKNITNENIYKSEQKQINKKKYSIYTLDVDKISYHFELAKHRINGLNYNDSIKELFNIKIQQNIFDEDLLNEKLE